MAKKKIGMFRRAIYGIVGLGGVSAIFAYFGMETPIGIIGNILYWGLVVGGINWGVVAITGKEDIFEAVGL